MVSLKFCGVRGRDVCDSWLTDVTARLPGFCPSPDRRESWLKGLALMRLFPPVLWVPLTQGFRQLIQTTVSLNRKRSSLDSQVFQLNKDSGVISFQDIGPGGTLPGGPG